MQAVTAIAPHSLEHAHRLNPFVAAVALLCAADTVIPVEDGRKFAATLPGNRLVEVQGADHNFRGNTDHLQQLTQAVLGFLKREEFTLPSTQQDESSSLASP
jgi:fermentation-respiration switch protein FrsA (DUF1100 family)